MERAALLALDGMFVCMACRMLARITCDTGIPRVASLALRKLLAVRTCVVGIKPAKLGLVGDATCPFEHAILPVHASCWSAAGSTVLLASATEINAGSGFALLSDGPAAVMSGVVEFASGGCWTSTAGSTRDYRRRRPREREWGACQGLAWPSRCDLFYSRPASTSGRVAACGPRRRGLGRGAKAPCSNARVPPKRQGFGQVSAAPRRVAQGDRPESTSLRLRHAK